MIFSKAILAAVFGLLLIWAFDPFEFIVAQLDRTSCILGCSLLVLLYGIVGLARGKFPRSGGLYPSLNGDRRAFWFFAAHAMGIGVGGTLLGLYDLGVLGS
jgi:hypothetical protein